MGKRSISPGNARKDLSWLEVYLTIMVGQGLLGAKEGNEEQRGASAVPECIICRVSNFHFKGVLLQACSSKERSKIKRETWRAAGDGHVTSTWLWALALSLSTPGGPKLSREPRAKSVDLFVLERVEMIDIVNNNTV